MTGQRTATERPNIATRYLPGEYRSASTLRKGMTAKYPTIGFLESLLIFNRDREPALSKIINITTAPDAQKVSLRNSPPWMVPSPNTPSFSI